MNRSVDNVYSAADPTLSQGAVRHKYVLGLYEVMEDMLTRHPDLLLEGCSGGGGRFDAGMLYYAPQICAATTPMPSRDFVFIMEPPSVILCLPCLPMCPFARTIRTAG